MSKIPTIPVSKREVRSLKGCELRVATAEDGSKSLTGFIPYDSLSYDLGGFREKLQKGCFSDALADGADVLCLYNHTVANLLGRTASGTMTLADSDEGLRYTVKLPNTTLGNDLAESVQRGDISATSFGFSVEDYDKDVNWEYVDGIYIRTLLKVTLYECSPVALPAYPDSAIALRSAPIEVRTRLERRDATACACPCDQCAAGNCADCSNDDCADDNCDCDDDGLDEERCRMEMTLALRLRRS